ncbi:kallikrein 6 [Mytilus galloprovincialis]|uniref:Kallikrein 6 n=1 Tax=Mytilus galloprovincialis TaxID=29158 RepID=A0A8B6E682_MYTGA|nr:kallikrein 6 [Mytilus galloprovincialis]
MYRVSIVSAFVVIYVASTFAADTSVKIVNGGDANIEDHSWMVSLQTRDYEGGNFTHLCGGAIIDRSWVLTAAHCVNYPVYEPKNMRVVAGSSFLSQMTQIIPLKKYYVHEKYIVVGGDGGIEPDLMLLQLKTPLKFGSTINKIDLDTDTGKNYTGELCTISGWGTTNATGANYPDRLQVLTMPVVAKDYCLASWNYPPTFLKNIVCLQDGKKDSCNRDSGGPLVCSKKLVGVLSFGPTPCDGRTPSVHIRVSAYTDWIKEKMKNKNNKNKKGKNNKNNNKGKKNAKDKKDNKEKKNNKNNKN